MAIQAVPGYTGYLGGYTGSGWSYPKAKKAPAVPPGAAMTPVESAIRTARGEPGVGSTLPALKALPAATPLITAPPPAYGPGAAPISGGGGGGGGGGDGGGSAAGFNPNDPYSLEITSDPLYQDALSNYNDQVKSQRDQLTNSLQQAVIRGGFGDFSQALAANPALSKYAGDINQDTLNAAQANQFSDRAQLQSQLDKGLASIPYGLSARGMLRSGAAYTQSRSLQDQFDVANATARQNLIDALTGQVNTYLGNTGSLFNAWQGQQNDIATRLAQAKGYSQPTDAKGNPTTTLPAPFTATTGTGNPTPKTVANVAKVKAALKTAPGMSPAATRAMAVAAGKKSARY